MNSEFFHREILHAARLEMDNTAQIIELLEKSDFSLLHQELDPAKANTWKFGPDLLKQLRLKIKTVRTHGLDHGRIFTRLNL